jgi:hypothetical protein
MDIEHARAHHRRAAICTALYTIWPRPMGAGLLVDSLTPDLAAAAGTISRDLAYLTDKGEVEVTGTAAGAGATLYRLTAAGVDRVESDEVRDLNAVRAVRLLRLRCLQALSWGGPAPLGLSLISTALAEDTDLDLSEPSLRRALAYLADPARRLACETHPGLYRITAAGTDYLEGSGDGIEGVARPSGW